MRLFLRLFLFFVLLRLPAVAQQGCRSAEYQQQMGHSRVIVNGVDGVNGGDGVNGVDGVNGAGGGGKSSAVITIPVVVHIVYNNSTQNISDAQVQSQIAVLNKDYRKQNPDTSKIPSYYKDLAADCGIRFMLANVDTNGNKTTGIIRRQTHQQGFSYNDAVKFTASGGDDAWDRGRYLNLWVCHLVDGVLGYSSAPGCPKQNDGVVIDYTAFGTMGTVAAPFNLGRTATHEIGHWLNLIHIWGDADCGNDDVDDTPQQGKATRGNPSGMVFSCGNTPYGNLYMDYMDFTDDAGMHLFTYGQRERMRNLFAEGGARYALLNSTGFVEGAAGDPAEDGSNMSMRIYPNPAVNTVQVTIDNPSWLSSELMIYNLAGQRVMGFKAAGKTFSLNISSLSAGLYFIRAGDGKSCTPLKLIKM